MKPQYLRIRNWERFQHYTNRRPPWVKYHVELLDDYELLHLPLPTQLVFDRLLLLSARTDNNIPFDPDHIGRQVTIEPDVVADAVQTLIQSGHLVLTERKRAASKAIAKRKHDAMPRRGTETETETEVEVEKKAEPELSEREQPALIVVEGEKPKKWSRCGVCGDTILTKDIPAHCLAHSSVMKEAS